MAARISGKSAISNQHSAISPEYLSKAQRKPLKRKGTEEAEEFEIFDIGPRLPSITPLLCVSKAFVALPRAVRD